MALYNEVLPEFKAFGAELVAIHPNCLQVAFSVTSPDPLVHWRNSRENLVIPGNPIPILQRLHQSSLAFFKSHKIRES
jgi:hypothetical protein